MKRASFLLICVMIFNALFAQKVHVVKKGDTLWDLSGYYYSNPYIWRNIYNANMDKISDPHWIYPGQEFIIPDVPADQTETVTETTETSYIQTETEDVIAEKETEEKNIVYTEVKEDETIGAVKSVREDIKKIERTKSVKISNSIEYAVAQKLAFRAGYLSVSNPKIGKITSLYKDSYQMVMNEKIYMQFDTIDESFKNKEFIIFRYETKVKDNENGESKGKHVNIIGCVKINGWEGNHAVGTITKSYDLIKKGDFIGFMNEPHVPLNSTYLKESEDIRASLIGTENPKLKTNEYTIVFVNAGKDKNINSGDVFTVIRKNKIGEYYAAGACQVLAPYEDYSTAAMISIKGNMDIKPYEELKLAYRNKTEYLLQKYNTIAKLTGDNTVITQESETAVVTTEEPVIEEVKNEAVNYGEPVVEEVKAVEEEPVIEETPIIEEVKPVEEKVEEIKPIIEEKTVETVVPIVEEEKKEETTIMVEEEEAAENNDTIKVAGEEEIIIIEEE
ncbi:MAG: LysM peptidoglycan-binding domain-containing protein [bacterium]